MTVIATIYYDTQDRANKGWAYRIDGGDSGALGDKAADAVGWLVDDVPGDLMGALRAIRAAVGPSVDLVRIVPAEGEQPITVDLYPQGR